MVKWKGLTAKSLCELFCRREIENDVLTDGNFFRRVKSEFQGLYYLTLKRGAPRGYIYWFIIFTCDFCNAFKFCLLITFKNTTYATSQRYQ